MQQRADVEGQQVKDVGKMYEHRFAPGGQDERIAATHAGATTGAAQTAAGAHVQGAQIAAGASKANAEAQRAMVAPYYGAMGKEHEAKAGEIASESEFAKKRRELDWAMYPEIAESAKATALARDAFNRDVTYGARGEGAPESGMNVDTPERRGGWAPWSQRGGAQTPLPPSTVAPEAAPEEGPPAFSLPPWAKRRGDLDLYRDYMERYGYTY